METDKRRTLVVVQPDTRIINMGLTPGLEQYLDEETDCAIGVHDEFNIHVLFTTAQRRSRTAVARHCRRR